jgi:hypothetical protein
MAEPRITAGTNRPYAIDVALSGDEMRALLGLAEETGMRPDEVMRHALRVYQATLHPPPWPRPIGCMGD